SKLRPVVEEAVARVVRVEDVFALAVELEAAPRQRQLVPRSDSARVAEYASGQERRFEVELLLLASLQVPSDPRRSCLEALIVVAALQGEPAVVGDEGRLRVVAVVRREVAVKTGVEFPALLLGRGCALLLRLERRGRKRQARQEDQAGALHPPRAIVRPTSATPIPTITR